MKRSTFIGAGALAIVAALGTKARGAVATVTNGQLVQYRATDGTAYTSQTTLQSDDVLILPVQANRAYRVEAFLPFNLAGIVSGYKLGLSGPASPSNVAISARVDNAVTGLLALSAIATALGLIIGGGLASAGNHFAHFEGTFENGANVGSLTVQIAQSTTDGSAIKLLRGARLVLTPLN